MGARLVGSLGLLLLAACQAQRAAAPACASGSAVITIYDGAQARMCGCTETAGTAVGPGTALDCTVTSGTTVSFYFVRTRLPHQIRFSGGPASLPTSREFDLDGGTAPHTVVPTATGTYIWTDQFNSQLTGNLIVI